MYVNVLTQKVEVNPSSPHKTPDNFFSEKIKKALMRQLAISVQRMCTHFHEFLAHSVSRWQNFFKKNWYSSSTLYDVSASEYDKHKDDISFTIRTLLFHFNEHDVAHESRIVVVCSSSGFSYLFFFCLSQKTCSCCCYFLFFFHIGIYDLCSKYVCVFYVVVCWLVCVCIFFSFFKAIFAWSKLETLCCIPLQPCGELKKHI